MGMTTLPLLLTSQKFDAYQLNSHTKIISMVKNNTLKINEKTPKTRLVLHLLSDTLVITSELDPQSNKRDLLYPPMPLTHITLDTSLVQNGYYLLIVDDRNKIYTLKLSPFSMLVIRPVDVNSGNQFIKELEMATEALKGEFLDETSGINKQEIAKNNTKDTPEIIQNTETKTLFETICRPYVFKASTSGNLEWTQLSRCTMSLFRIGECTYIALHVVETKITLLTYKLDPSTIFGQVGPKRMDIYMLDGQSFNRYLIAVSSSEVLQILLELLTNERLRSFQSIYQSLKDNLKNEQIQWFIGEQYKSFKLETIELCNHSRCFINPQNEKWTAIGPVSTYIVITKEGELNGSTQIHIRSDLDSKRILLSIELDKSKYIAKKECEKYAILRILKGSSYIDIRLFITNDSLFLEKLEEYTSIADIARTERRKKLEQRVQRLLILGIGDFILSVCNQRVISRKNGIGRKPTSAQISRSYSQPTPRN
jgi:hypothetical protein